jgi:S1-C subfamily serine protease
VVVAINGHAVQSSEDIVRIVTATLLPGQIARFTVRRGGERREISVRLGERAQSSG